MDSERLRNSLMGVFMLLSTFIVVAIVIGFVKLWIIWTDFILYTLGISFIGVSLLLISSLPFAILLLFVSDLVAGKLVFKLYLRTVHAL